MIRGKVQRGEVVPVRFHFGTNRNRKADATENLYDLVDHPGHWVLGAHPALASGHGEIQARLLLLPAIGLESFTPLSEGFLELRLEAIDGGAIGFALFDRPGGNRTQCRRELAALP